MATFVLVHGSGQNAESWSRVAGLLRARGHVVITPELPKQASPERTLEDYAAEIGRSIPSPGAVLVGHSFSGVFLPLVPRVSECALLVFLAAVIPEPGKSVRDQFTADPSMFNPEWIRAGPRWFDKSQTEGLAREFLFHDCDDATLDWALRTIEAVDTRYLATQPSPLARWPDVPAASIVASEDRTLSPGWIRRASRRALKTDPIELHAGHCPHSSRPVDVAEALERLAAQSDLTPR